MVGYEDPTFFIKSGDVGFADRQKSIFDKLTVAEKERNDRIQESGPQALDNNSRIDSKHVLSRKRCRSEMKQFRGKESIFKRPEAPPPRFKEKGVPDYHRHPHKWVKYSLADVSQEDMSDRSNTAAAFTFLREMEERKSQEKMDVDEVTNHTITFKQPKNKARLLSHHDSAVNIISSSNPAESSDGDEKPSFRCTKLVMPEYVVGLTKKKDKKKHDKPECLPKNETITSHIKLGHLVEEDDGE